MTPPPSQLPADSPPGYMYAGHDGHGEPVFFRYLRPGDEAHFPPYGWLALVVLVPDLKPEGGRQW